MKDLSSLVHSFLYECIRKYESILRNLFQYIVVYMARTHIVVHFLSVLCRIQCYYAYCSAFSYNALSYTQISLALIHKKHLIMLYIASYIAKDHLIMQNERAKNARGAMFYPMHVIYIQISKSA